MEKMQTMLNGLDIQQLWSEYLIPWSLNIVLAIITFLIGRLVVKIIVNVVGKLLRRSKMEDILVEFVSSIVNAVLLLFVIIASLNQLGVDTTSLIALLGAAGLAIGLALQGSLQNFAAGVMILIFRPFKAGDYIEAAGTAGIVETISIFTTKMRSGDNKEIIVPNGKIFGGNITNYSARDTRRIDMTFGISYDSDLRKARDILQQLLDSDERVLPEPAPVIAVSELADSSVNFIVRPWVKASDYWPLKYEYTEKVKLTFDENGITIPFPQMDVHVSKSD